MADENTTPPAPEAAAPQAAPPGTQGGMDIPLPLTAKKSFLKKLMAPPLIFVVIAVIAVASAGGTFLFIGAKKHGAVADAGEAVAAEEKKEEKAHGEEKAGDAPKVSEEEKKPAGEAGSESVDGTIVKLEPGVFNIMEKNSIHYLKLKMELVMNGGEEAANEVKSRESQIKDKILFLVSDASLRDLMTVGGKTLFKEDLQSSFNKMLKKGMIKQIYFTEFTIQ